MVFVILEDSGAKVFGFLNSYLGTENNYFCTFNDGEVIPYEANSATEFLCKVK